MNLFSYKLDHDFGLAPNPFWGTLSLAVCKGQIRNNPNLDIGDWIIGTTSKKLGGLNRLIYAMRVDEIISFDTYWADPLFECKKPIINGSLCQIYGDNFYHTDPQSGKVIQEQSAHSNEDGTPNLKHLKADSFGRNVLLSKHFYYFGNCAPTVPLDFDVICSKVRDYHYRDIPEDVKLSFISWLEMNYAVGIYGDPISWGQYNLDPLDCFEELQ